MLGGQQGEDQDQDQDQPPAAAAEPMEEEVEQVVVQPQLPAPGNVVSTPLCCFG